MKAPTLYDVVIWSSKDRVKSALPEVEAKEFARDWNSRASLETWVTIEPSRKWAMMPARVELEPAIAPAAEQPEPLVEPVPEEQESDFSSELVNPASATPEKTYGVEFIPWEVDEDEPSATVTVDDDMMAVILSDDPELYDDLNGEPDDKRCFLPTLQEIKDACLAIQKTWSPAEFRRRAVGVTGGGPLLTGDGSIATPDWMPPVVRGLRGAA